MPASHQLVPVLLTVALLAPPLSAQAPAARFLDRVEVRVAEIDVVVLDRDGNPVRGLGRGDFELLEDGRPVEIANFLAYEEELATAGEPAAAVAPAGEGEPAAPAAPPASWLVYLDQDRLELSARNQVLRQLGPFLATAVRPGDRVLVATFDGASLKLLAPLATDVGAASAALSGLEKKTGFSSMLDARRALLQRQILSIDTSSLDAVGEAETALDEIDQLALEESQRGRLEVAALRDLLALASGLEGRVAVLFAGAGFETRPGESLYRLWQSRFGPLTGRASLDRELDSSWSDARREYGRLLTSINGGRFTFYTLQAGSGRVAGVSAEQPSEAALLSGGDTEAIRLGSSMAALASETGGRTFTVAPDLRQRLEVVRRDLATYYSLGYHPANEEPGRKRRIEVRVRRPDVRVLARTQLADPEAADRLSDTAVTALLAEEGGANPLGIVIDVRPGAAAERRRGAALVPVEVRVPLARVTLLPDGARHRAQLTFQFAARDPDGGFRRLESRPLAFDVPNDRLAQALSQSVTFRVEIPFAPGSHRLAAAVLDELAGTLSTATAPVVVALR